MRRLLLTLPDTVTGTECGECEHVHMFTRYTDGADCSCNIYGAIGFCGLGRVGLRRHPDCLAAEAAASRLVDIAPEDVAKVRFELWGDDVGDGGAWDAITRIEDALRAHAGKVGR